MGDLEISLISCGKASMPFSPSTVFGIFSATAVAPGGDLNAKADASEDFGDISFNPKMVEA